MASKKTTNTNTSPQPEVEQLKQELENMRSQKLKAMADLDNYRKRMDAEKAKFGLLTNMQLVMQILELIDDVKLAQNDSELDAERAREVLAILQDKLRASINIAGVEPVDVQSGDEFNPALMEAITTIPANEQQKSNTVVEVLSSAYRYAGQEQLLRTAKVVVAK